MWVVMVDPQELVIGIRPSPRNSWGLSKTRAGGRWFRLRSKVERLTRVKVCESRR